jgi:outer membrane receptor protein involved in Fe transport
MVFLLICVYGVGGGPTSQADLPTDYGNGASEINQENIESVNVLKGAASAIRIKSSKWSYRDYN